MLHTDEQPRQERVRRLLEIWAHNRKLYPGWLVFPSGQERTDVSRRTSEWESPILDASPDFPPVERLNAIRELIWRREALLEPISPELEAAAQDALNAVDWQRRTAEGLISGREDWAEVREAWRTVALALVTDARLDFNRPLLDERLNSLMPFSGGDLDVAHRIQQEYCLWAAYSLDFDLLNELLDSWMPENCDPAWMLRKAALLTEARRFDESRSLIKVALESIRRDHVTGKSIASASREGWALASTMTFDNQQEISREWESLAVLKCDAGTELDYVNRALKGVEEREEAPSFDPSIRESTRIKFSGASRARMVAAYRAIRLSEVTGLPPVNNPDGDTPVPLSLISDTLKSAADELAAIKPELSIRLVLRTCSYDRDRMLQRVLSRSRVASLSFDSVVALAQICIGTIKHSLVRLFTPQESVWGLSWIERMRVTLEVLSRITLRLPAPMANEALSVGMDCYRTEGVAQHPWLATPVRSLLARSWAALPNDLRARRAPDLLVAPIAGFEGFTDDANCPDPADFINADDMTTVRVPSDEVRYREVVDFLARGLRGGEGTRRRATLRLIPLVLSDSLTDTELQDVATALWGNFDPVLSNSLGRNSPFDWVYLILPQLEEGSAERSLRRKWLSPDFANDVESSNYASDMLTQIGAAVAGLKAQDLRLEFSTEEERHIAANIQQLVESFFSRSVSINLFGIRTVIDGLASLAVEITIPQDVARNLFQRVDPLLGSQNQLRDSFLRHLYEIRISIGFALIPGLLKAMPDHVDTMVLWLRTGLVSEDDERIGGSMGALRSWLTASFDSKLSPVPDDLIREVGAMIASGRRTALAEALLCAEAVFDKGSQSNRETISPLALQGLSYLAETLEYDPTLDKGDDVHTLRILCTRLAMLMARNGFENDATVAKWLDIAEGDPFPESRYVIGYLGSTSQNS